MPRYRYIAHDTAGQEVQGAALAASPEALRRRLEAKGFLLAYARPASVRLRPLASEPLALFCRSLGTLLVTGIPLVGALELLARDAGVSRRLRRECDALDGELQKGVPLSLAMEGRLPVFPPLLIRVVRSAEGTGNMGQSLLQMARYYEQAHRLQQEITTNLLYPTLLALLTAGVVFLLIVFILPMFRPLLEQLDSLPSATILLFACSDAVLLHWPVFLSAAATLFLAAHLVRGLPTVRRGLDRAALYRPLTGPYHRRLCSARFARTLADLYAAGVPLLEALDVGRQTCGNSWLAARLRESVAAVRAGQSLFQALSLVDELDRALLASVRVGEETGRLAELLAGNAAALDEDARQAVHRLVLLIEPLLILAMGLVVGAVMAAVLLPLYQSYSVIGL